MCLKRVIVCQVALLVALHIVVLGALAWRSTEKTAPPLPSALDHLSQKLGPLALGRFAIEDQPEKVVLQQWIGSFAGTEHAAFQEVLRRGSHYRPMIESALL